MKKIMIGISIAAKKEWEAALKRMNISIENCSKFPFGEYFKYNIPAKYNAINIPFTNRYLCELVSFNVSPHCNLHHKRSQFLNYLLFFESFL